MSAPQSNLDAEREIDLARWRSALRTRWWLLAAGLIAGAVVGVLFSFGGNGSVYKASSLISLGQPVSPGGVVLQGFGQNPRAVSQITSSAAAQDAAAHIAGMHPGALRGNVSIATVGTATGAGVRAAPLISLTVQGKVAAKIAKAANALAAIVVDKTTAPYVGTKIATYVQVLATTNSQLASIANRLAQLNRALKVSHLDALNELVLVSQIDNAEQRQGNLNDQKATTQQQLAFSRNVESAKVITKAVSQKSTARSRSTSLIIGALIGLLLGAIVAVVADGRAKRAVAAA
jgi:F0F1-type ATP synthase assembly protein I